MAANDDDLDPLYIEARRHVLAALRCSTSDLQRTLQIGFNKASALIERLELEGVVSFAPDQPA
jgi:DNA segregation ATPase FtsK/SpoIIIE, S-DNA-T family